MKNMKIHIIGGTGEMGNWLKNFLESQGLIVSVSGRNGVSKENLQKAEIIFISVPVSEAAAVIKDVASKVNINTTLIDLSSIQQEVVKTLQETNLPSAGLHFLFGPKVTSVQNQKIILINVSISPQIQSIKSILEKMGAQVFEMDAKTHDFYMAHLQNLIHFTNLALAKSLIKSRVGLNGKISTPNFLAQLSVISSIISQPSSLIAEIQFSNKEAKNVLAEFINYQQKLLNCIFSDDKDTLIKELETIHQTIDSTAKITRQVKIDTKTFFPRLAGTIAYLGPRGTFSHQASLLVASEKNLLPVDSIYQIFEAISAGKADFGVVPAENSTEGTVRETIDYLIEFNLHTNGSIDLPIHQNLISNEKKLQDIKVVYSHPQALAQCRKWLQENLPQVKQQATSSTVSSMKSYTKGAAFIASNLAAEMNNIDVLVNNIEDNNENVTKFYIISKDINKVISKSPKTLLFLTVFNRVGILRDILDIFASNNINLSKIESRPSREKVWDYYFYIEIEISREDKKFNQVFNLLKQFCPVIKVIGGV